ncbi:Phage Tail Collar Domain [Achromobacter sp. 2789STDY5608615]|uniref:phage tail protein n=1 Tax=Achromobacter sp. 2789STDY5608615 TaxID=1806492 RepID=UPI0006C532FF|nr:phage tail protein [Achromobacter sp. 2789STDY5608615]CUK22052.1 Phage Tail Collar Domain [Achromobacter sp. 2789STDY5608615]
MQLLKPINVGHAPNDQTGDTLRDAMAVVNENFAKTRAGVDSVEVSAAAAQRKADAAVPAAEKGAAGGVTPLDAAGKVPAAHLPPPAVPLSQKSAPGGVAPLDDAGRVPVDHLPISVPAVPLAEKGQPDGVATLAADGKITPVQLPDLIPAAEKARPNGVATLAADGRIVPGQLPALIPAADKGRPGGVPTLDADGRVPAAQLPAVQDAVPLAEKGQAGGVATLGGDGKVPAGQLPVIDSIPLGFVSWWPSRAAIPAGWAPLDGQTISRAAFPDIWAILEAGKFPLVPEATWQSDVMARASYTAGDGATTLRLPDLNGKSAGSLGAVMLRGDGALSSGVAGQIQRDAMQAMTGEQALTYGVISGPGSGPFVGSRQGDRAARTSPSYPATTAGDTLRFDNSVSVRTATENRPLNATGCWVIKLFGAVVQTGVVDVDQLVSDFALLSAQLQTLKDAIGFTIVYPGGGNSSAPGLVAINSQYVLANPFPGYHLVLEPEVLYNGEWGNPGWWDGEANMAGVRASMRGGKIVVSTARNALGIGSGLGGGAFAYTGSTGLGAAGLPARVKVWKMMAAV